MIAAAAYPKFLAKDFAAMDFSAEASLLCARSGLAFIEKATSDFAFLGALFDVHVFEFAGLEDFPAFLALDKFAIFLAAHYLHARVFARLLGSSALRSRR